MLSIIILDAASILSKQSKSSILSSEGFLNPSISLIPFNFNISFTSEPKLIFPITTYFKALIHILSY